MPKCPPTSTLLLLIALVCGGARNSSPPLAAAFTWADVKPMYLVSMFPPPMEMREPMPPAATAAAETAIPPMEPIVLNLETPPMQDEMLPGGSQAMDRIFGGNVARPHGFPHQVGLLLERPRGIYWCGGSLISAKFVLTAAHCVDMAKRAVVFLGAHEIKNAKESGQMRLMVHHENFLIFPTWNPRRLKDDIALVRLPHAIKFTSRIRPIQLPKRSYEYRTFKNKLAIASGWGRYATGVHAISNELRFVKLQIIDGGTCKRSFPFSYRSTNICTSGKAAKSTCNGDSGGPLVLRRRHSKKLILIGITSFGSIFGCDRGYPAAFTKVAAYLDWIGDETGVEPTEDDSGWLQHHQQPHHDHRHQHDHHNNNAIVFSDLIEEYDRMKGERQGRTVKPQRQQVRRPTKRGQDRQNNGPLPPTTARKRNKFAESSAVSLVFFDK